MKRSGKITKAKEIQMKGLKSRLKKGMVFALSLAMAAGLAPAMSGGADTVQAAEGAAEPEVSLYATKNQMMDDTFKPGADGNTTSTGKLAFGNKEWYILGSDSGVPGENTIIFAARPFSNSTIPFCSDTNQTKKYTGTDVVYTADFQPSDVNVNHYGTSDLRRRLNEMATEYFTPEEQNLMNATPVKTIDTKNNCRYTTTDKLYALSFNYDASLEKICAGSEEGTVILNRYPYWNKEADFWLRSPSSIGSDETDANKAWYATNSAAVLGNGNNEQHSIRPAANLDLTNVLFASAVGATTSGEVRAEAMIPPEDGISMTLRLDGSSKDIGTVTCNYKTGEIKASKGTTSDVVALVVQGKNEYYNWYYRKPITGSNSVIVTASEIKESVNSKYITITSDINLSRCKIWLETTSEYGMLYAVDATEDTGVPQAPNITGQPQDKTIKAGESATFTVEASGTDLTYQWQIDLNNGYGWQNISSATGKEYTISEVNIKDSGLQVRCVVSNAGGSITTNAATLTVTENTVPSPNPVNYDIIDGANSAWTQNTDGSLVIRGNGDYAKFQHVIVDGTVIGAENYTVTEGSTIITLKADYLRTLSAGSHTFEIVWTDGSAGTVFTVNTDSTGNTGNNPDSNNNGSNNGDSGNNNNNGSNPDNSNTDNNNTDNGNTDNSNTDNGNVSSSPSVAQPQNTTNNKDAVPKTGEHTPFTWLYLPAILSGAGLILTAKRGRKKQEVSED